MLIRFFVPQRSPQKPQLHIVKQLCQVVRKRAALWYFIFPFFCLIVPSLAQVGPNKQYFLVKDLTKEWLVYDQSEKEYVPYVTEQHSGQLAV